MEDLIAESNLEGWVEGACAMTRANEEGCGRKREGGAEVEEEGGGGAPDSDAEG